MDDYIPAHSRATLVLISVRGSYHSAIVTAMSGRGPGPLEEVLVTARSNVTGHIIDGPVKDLVSCWQSKAPGSWLHRGIDYVVVTLPAGPMPESGITRIIIQWVPSNLRRSSGLLTGHIDIYCFLNQITFILLVEALLLTDNVKIFVPFPNQEEFVRLQSVINRFLDRSKENSMKLNFVLTKCSVMIFGRLHDLRYF
ncbi:hypothetical protein J6590_043558 [Homalodisca vitripennis]|nr:hypothetical protein J6590_043558 [Homalodisca vitripennis]